MKDKLLFLNLVLGLFASAASLAKSTVSPEAAKQRAKDREAKEHQASVVQYLNASTLNKTEKDCFNE